MPNKRSEENEYRVTGSVLDELGLDRQAALELKLEAALHQNILQLVKRRGYRARDLERILRIQQPRVSELMRGKLSTLSVARLLNLQESFQIAGPISTAFYQMQNVLVQCRFQFEFEGGLAVQSEFV